MNTSASLVPPSLRPATAEVRHTIHDKLLGGLLALLMLASAGGAAETKGSCCAPKEPPKTASCCAKESPAPEKKDACCAAIEGGGAKTAGLTADSLYQLDATFTGDNGETFSLASLRGRPVVLTMFFASCGYACPMLVSDMTAIRAKLPAEIRDRAALVLVSFDVERDTPAALKKYRDERHLDAQWVLLHGEDASVRELAALLGVKYVREADGNFAHSNLITVLNAEGEVVHQRSGLRGGLDETAQAIAAAN
jgi:protein SCO1/2